MHMCRTPGCEQAEFHMGPCTRDLHVDVSRSARRGKRARLDETATKEQHGELLHKVTSRKRSGPGSEPACAGTHEDALPCFEQLPSRNASSASSMTSQATQVAKVAEPLYSGQSKSKLAIKSALVAPEGGTAEKVLLKKPASNALPSRQPKSGDQRASTEGSCSLPSKNGAAAALVVRPRPPQSAVSRVDFCFECGGDESKVGNALLRCNGSCCNACCHQSCLHPPAPSELPAPSSEWLCPHCQAFSSALGADLTPQERRKHCPPLWDSSVRDAPSGQHATYSCGDLTAHSLEGAWELHDSGADKYASAGWLGQTACPDLGPGWARFSRQRRGVPNGPGGLSHAYHMWVSPDGVRFRSKRTASQYIIARGIEDACVAGVPPPQVGAAASRPGTYASAKAPAVSRATDAVGHDLARRGAAAGPKSRRSDGFGRRRAVPAAEAGDQLLMLQQAAAAMRGPEQTPRKAAHRSGAALPPLRQWTRAEEEGGAAATDDDDFEAREESDDDNEASNDCRSAPGQARAIASGRTMDVWGALCASAQAAGAGLLHGSRQAGVHANDAAGEELDGDFDGDLDGNLDGDRDGDQACAPTAEVPLAEARLASLGARVDHDVSALGHGDATRPAQPPQQAWRVLNPQGGPGPQTAYHIVPSSRTLLSYELPMVPMGPSQAAPVPHWPYLHGMSAVQASRAAPVAHSLAMPASSAQYYVAPSHNPGHLIGSNELRGCGAHHAQTHPTTSYGGPSQWRVVPRPAQSQMVHSVQMGAAPTALPASFAVACPGAQVCFQ